jgi:hypothetical protein
MVVPIRLLLVAVFGLCAMGMLANAALLRRAGISPGCSIVHQGAGPTLETCHAGWFKGYPNLLARGCTSVGVTAKQQFWSCPSP